MIERAVILSSGDYLNLDAVLPLPSESSDLKPSSTEAERPNEILTASELRELERVNLVRALESSGWRVAGPKGAAKRLGMAPSTLNSRLKALGIDRGR